MAVRKQTTTPTKKAPTPQPTRPMPQVAGASSPGKVPSPHVVAQHLAGMLGKQGPVTQRFGQQSQFDVFSKGVSPAHEIALPVGTSLATPSGQWKVVSATSNASKRGFIGNFEGQGWGNNVRLQNVQTGEIIGYNHMNDVNVQPGQILGGGVAVGTSGMSGNATGPHVAITYRGPQGKAEDFASSPYFKELYTGVQPSATLGAGQPTMDASGQITAPKVMPLSPSDFRSEQTQTQQPQQTDQYQPPAPAPIGSQITVDSSNPYSSNSQYGSSSGKGGQTGYFPWWKKESISVNGAQS